jgi:hypothetical protein
MLVRDNGPKQRLINRFPPITQFTLKSLSADAEEPSRLAANIEFGLNGKIALRDQPQASIARVVTAK